MILCVHSMSVVEWVHPEHGRHATPKIPPALHLVHVDDYAKYPAQTLQFWRLRQYCFLGYSLLCARTRYCLITKCIPISTRSRISPNSRLLAFRWQRCC